MRKQQKDIKAKRFLDEEDLDSSNLTPKTRQRNNARDKNKRYT